MNTYLDVGVARIQAYLSRSNRLRSRARASSGITDLSTRFSARAGEPTVSLAELLGRLADGWRFNEELGKIDGVISLVHNGSLTDGHVAPVAEQVLATLRAHWPGADLTAVWGDGGSYVEAYRDHLRPALAQAGKQTRSSTAAAAELPLGQPCGLCEQDIAVQVEQVVEKRYGLCVDCLNRGVHRSGAKAGTRATLLEEIAERGKPANHLGTVFLDGNAVGALFDGLSRAAPDTRHHLSRALSDATAQALEAAVEHIRKAEEARDLTIHLTHVSGGDDVLVSVPADRCWSFTRKLVSGFTDEVSAAIGRLLGVDPAEPDLVREKLRMVTGGAVTELPSAAAGVVIHHHTSPFALVVEAAHERLRAAKQAVQGSAPALAWTDLTIDGDQPPSWRQPWPAADLKRAEPSLARLATAPASARHTAARLIDPAQPATSWCRLQVHLERLDRDDSAIRDGAQAYLDDAARADDPAPAMTRLLDALAIARWW